MSDQLGPVILDIEGTVLTNEDRDLLIHPLVGGLIFFTRNFQSRDQLLDLVATIRALRPNLLLSVDQEGGRVQRFQAGFTRLPAMSCFRISSADDLNSVLPLVRDCGWLMASEILACDIDLSFAPVLDVDDHHCAAIANRSFSPEPAQVATLAGAFIEGMNEAGMASTGKHFPGHGGVIGDSHETLPVDPRPLAQIQEKDLLPFARLSAQLNAVMPAHIVFPDVDEHAVGFSSAWLKQKLRSELGFTGIIFSDDLTMEGAASVGSYGDRAELALNAGCDVVLVCNNREGAREVLARLDERQITADDGLSSMRQRQKVTWSQLERNPRWQNTRNQLAALVKSGA